MNCVVTSGPSYEELDQVRRLTNFSSGKLGSLLAQHLAVRGHRVVLLRGHYSTYHHVDPGLRPIPFASGEDLARQLQKLEGSAVDAVYHAAAVCDFRFGRVWQRQPDGNLTVHSARKIPTATRDLLVELVPTAKIIEGLRTWFPHACLVGWKYEVDGDRPQALRRAEEQLIQCQTDACVANGPAYGFGYGVVTPPAAHTHYSELPGLFASLEKLALAPRRD